MSRARISSCRPRGGTFRPQLEALEDRLTPGALPGAPQPPPDLAFLAGIYAAQQQAATQTTSPVVTIADGIVRGESTLIRTDNGVSIHLKTSGLLPGAYTAWWAVFNPGAVGPTVGFATSHVVGPSGTATFAAHLNEGEPLLGHPLSRGPLLDAQTAEIHLVIRYHGPADPGRFDEQLHTFELALDTDGDPATGNVQVTRHPPPA